MWTLFLDVVVKIVVVWQDLAGIDKLVGDIIKEHGGGGVMGSNRRETQEVSKRLSLRCTRVRLKFVV